LQLGRALAPLEKMEPLIWADRCELSLPGELGRLIAEPGEQGIDSGRWSEGKVEVRFRRGGERCLPRGQGHHRPLKKLFQEWGVPPWERGRIPLVYVDGELAAIPGRLVCRPFAADDGQSSIVIRWESEGGSAR
jgi:tRNA(Ile)-lysidine synthase